MAKRFTVGSVTGYAITPGLGRQPDRPPVTVWYVQDSAYCFATLGVFHTHPSRDSFALSVVGSRARNETAQDFARRYAAGLERRYGQ